MGVTVFGTTQTQQLNVSGISTFSDGMVLNGGNITLLDRPDGNNNNLFFGTGGKAVIYHDGTNFSQVNNTGHFYLGVGVASKDLMLYAQASGNVLLQQNTGVRYVKGVGSDASVQLFFNNNEKLKTSNTGISVTGKIHTTGTGEIARFQSTNSVSTIRLYSTASSYTEIGHTEDTYIAVGGAQRIRIKLSLIHI